MIRRIGAIVPDNRCYCLLYLAEIAQGDPAFDVWVPASDFGVCDAQLQAELKKSQRSDPSIVSFLAGHGDGVDIDPNKPIPRETILDSGEDDRYVDPDGNANVLGDAIDDGDGAEESVEEAPPELRRSPRLRLPGAQPGAARATPMDRVAGAAAQAAVAAMQDEERQQSQAAAMQRLLRKSTLARAGLMVLAHAQVAPPLLGGVASMRDARHGDDLQHTQEG